MSTSTKELSKDLVGAKMDAFEFTVERGKIKEFCAAIGDDNPIFTDAELAKKEGYKDVPIPLTFPTTFSMWGFGYENLFQGMSDMGIDVGRLLHLKEEYEYLAEIYPGDTVKGQTEVVDVKTGKMDMVTFQTSFTRDGAEVLKVRMAIVIRPEDK